MPSQPAPSPTLSTPAMLRMWLMCAVNHIKHRRIKAMRSYILYSINIVQKFFIMSKITVQYQKYVHTFSLGTVIDNIGQAVETGKRWGQKHQHPFKRCPASYMGRFVDVLIQHTHSNMVKCTLNQYFDIIPLPDGAYIQLIALQTFGKFQAKHIEPQDGLTCKICYCVVVQESDTINLFIALSQLNFFQFCFSILCTIFLLVFINLFQAMQESSELNS